MISSIILAKNEAARIGQCLSNLVWTDEQIVVDNGSSDETKKIAVKHKASVLEVPDADFSTIRNEGAKKAKGDWLLYIDADETIPQDLATEIKSIVKQFQEDKDPHAYRIMRKNYYLGHSWPAEDGMIRLIFKPSFEGWYGKLHETAKIRGKVGVLTNRLVHITHRSLEEMLEKTNQWSTIEADLRYKNNHPQIVVWRLFRVMITGFFRSYIKEKGWKAGTIGITESIYQGFSMFVTYAKLWEMQRKK